MSVNPERWRRLKDLFEAALELDPSARAGFLDRACSEDPGMRDEAEALLRHHESGDGFLERPAYEESAYLLTSAPSGGQPEEMPLGPYTLVRKLGEGGMGIVYLARDTRLGRPVAIKALPPRFTRDERLRARLRSEAVAVARLSHPGIATIYSLEEIDGNLYLVLEYVRGRTLREELEGKPLPPPRILDTAVQVARALSAAHAQGIVHRDLKPENVMLSEGGGVKILDFGLARFLGPPLPEGVRETRLTQSGTFVGTPAYASPEQLVGGEMGGGRREDGASESRGPTEAALVVAVSSGRRGTHLLPDALPPLENLGMDGKPLGGTDLLSRFGRGRRRRQPAVSPLVYLRLLPSGVEGTEAPGGHLDPRRRYRLRGPAVGGGVGDPPLSGRRGDSAGGRRDRQPRSVHLDRADHGPSGFSFPG